MVARTAGSFADVPDHELKALNHCLGRPPRNLTAYYAWPIRGTTHLGAGFRGDALRRADPGLVDLAEASRYLRPRRTSSKLDLMVAADAGERSAGEIGLVREAAFHAGALTQVANMAITWRREVPARDFSTWIQR